ncbi:hypothetical protein OG948_59945 (plasmid) [Embleya sp. NBC_00888]|uniref:hypothetical protein n=1 Tax=Embleya sp. NBC_00888 TaxID=2975960 RepID=UPI0038657FBA|nr:hypothetical protein OG948_59945 [Embleya sp. NBC_00888]
MSVISGRNLSVGVTFCADDDRRAERVDPDPESASERAEGHAPRRRVSVPPAMIVHMTDTPAPAAALADLDAYAQAVSII